MEKPNFYAIIPAYIRYDARLCLGARMLFGEITALSNKFGFCTAGNAYFQELYQKDERTILRWLKALADCGYIRCDYEYSGKKIVGRKLYILEPLIDTRQNEPQPDIKNDTPDQSQPDIFVTPAEISPTFLSQSHEKSQNQPDIFVGDNITLIGRDINITRDMRRSPRASLSQIAEIFPKLEVLSAKPKFTLEKYKALRAEYDKSPFLQRVITTLGLLHQRADKILRGEYRPFPQQSAAAASPMAIQNTVPSKILSAAEINAQFDGLSADDM